MCSKSGAMLRMCSLNLEWVSLFMLRFLVLQLFPCGLCLANPGFDTMGRWCRLHHLHRMPAETTHVIGFDFHGPAYRADGHRLGEAHRRQAHQLLAVTQYDLAPEIFFDALEALVVDRVLAVHQPFYFAVVGVGPEYASVEFFPVELGRRYLRVVGMQFVSVGWPGVDSFPALQ